MDNLLTRKMQSRTATTCVLGLGYVGLPLAIEMIRAGFAVIGVDSDQDKIEALRQRRSHVQDVSDTVLADALNTGRLHVTDDPVAISEADAVSICVPTPLRKTKDPDLRFVLSAANDTARFIRPGSLVVLESTTYPGTTDEILGGALRERGFVIGKDIFVAFSPERVDPGNRVFHTKNTPKVIGGLTPACGQIAAVMYGCFIDQVILVSSARVAETVKLLENTFRSVNIGLVNEMAMMCDRMGIDVWEVIAAAATKPFGFMPFYPGPGIGGHCIPLDPQYLSWKAKTFNFYNRFIELASDINGNMPRYAVGRISEALNASGKALSRSRVLVLGVAYKRDINDVRESPSIEIINLLLQSGTSVDYNDPYVPEIATIHGTVSSVALTPANVAQYDCVVVGTDHTCYDMSMICSNAQSVFDTRHSTRGHDRDNVVVLGDGWQPDFANVGTEGDETSSEDHAHSTTATR